MVWPLIPVPWVAQPVFWGVRTLLGIPTKTASLLRWLPRPLLRSLARQRLPSPGDCDWDRVSPERVQAVAIATGARAVSVRPGATCSSPRRKVINSQFRLPACRSPERVGSVSAESKPGVRTMPGGAVLGTPGPFTHSRLRLAGGRSPPPATQPWVRLSLGREWPVRTDNRLRSPFRAPERRVGTDPEEPFFRNWP